MNIFMALLLSFSLMAQVQSDAPGKGKKDPDDQESPVDSEDNDSDENAEVEPSASGRTTEVAPRPATPAGAPARSDRENGANPSPAGRTQTVDPMAAGCPFIIDDARSSDLVPSRATIQAMLDESRRVERAGDAARNAANCGTIYREVETLLAMTDEREDSRNPNASFNESCRIQANQNLAICNPGEFRRRLSQLLTNANTCGESREGLIDAITGVALLGSRSLGPAGSLIGLGVTVVTDLFNLFKRKRNRNHSSAHQTLLYRNIACVVNRTWYNTICPEAMLDQILTRVGQAPIRSEACTENPSQSSPREGLVKVFECLQTGQKTPEQCLACNKVQFGDNVVESVSANSEDQIRTALSAEAAVDINIRRTVLPEMITLARDFHSSEARALFNNIQNGFREFERNGNVPLPSFKSQEYRQLINHCYLGYLSQRLNPPQLEIILTNPRDRDFNTICSNLNSCIEPRPEGVVSLEGFDQGGRGVTSSCSMMTRLETNRELAPRLPILSRTLASNRFGAANGCSTREWNRSRGSGEAQRQ